MRTPPLIGAILGLAVAATLVAAPSQALEPGFYSVPYDDQLLLHEHDDAGVGSTRYGTFAEWSVAGFPAPAPAPTDYVKYAWWPNVFAVHTFGPDRADSFTESINAERWTRAGRPAPATTAWVDYFTSATRWSSSPEVFFGLATDWGPGFHKVTNAEWLAAGSPVPDQRAGGFYRYPWSASIGFVWNTETAEGEPLSYDDWANDYGFPTPEVVVRLGGEVVWKKAGSSTLYLDSPITGDNVALTYSQWTALGRPAPVVR